MWFGYQPTIYTGIKIYLRGIMIQNYIELFLTCTCKGEVALLHVGGVVGGCGLGDVLGGGTNLTGVDTLNENNINVKFDFNIF